MLELHRVSTASSRNTRASSAARTGLWIVSWQPHRTHRKCGLHVSGACADRDAVLSHVALCCPPVLTSARVFFRAFEES
eukprot:352249-Chlamydomonas_euryale.AAC.11